MKWLDSDSIDDISRGPVTLAEQDEATDAWKILRHLTSCADINGRESYTVQVTTRGGVFRAEYTALESTSFYREVGFGTDPIEAMRHMHDCTDDTCTDDKHRGALARIWADINA